jgi:alpha-L-arabinofuranosidase
MSNSARLRPVLLLPALVLALRPAPAAAAAPTPPAHRIAATVAAAHAGTPISPELYGVFFEDINYAADGGLYAELVQNRSFEYYPFKRHGNSKEIADLDPLHAWSPVERGGTRARLETAILQPLHRDNPTYLVLTLTGPTGTAGVANTGFDGGISVRTGATYDFSLYARRLQGGSGPLTVALEAPDGSRLAGATLPAPGPEWAHQETVLTVDRTEPRARLVLTAAAPARLAFDMVSLFPRDTFKGRRNGLRRDLAQAIADLHPRTFRFPGGCIVHGTGLANAYRWKDTVGDIAHRRPNFNRWGYHQSYGLGYFEYFQFCEDIGAAPLPILPCGVSCGFQRPYQVANDTELAAWIEDALDLIEFANGPVTSRWGAVRAGMGHPAPFGLRYLGLGNEEHDTPSFRAVFPRFVQAVRARHPEIVLVGTSGLGPGIPLRDLMQQTGVDVTDEHYYQPPEWFVANRHRFDRLERRGPKVYVGEYASRGNTLYHAVAEATYLTGIERNADWVVMTAYAPLLARYDYTQWKAANLIWFDSDRPVLTPNYHVQRLFATHLGDRALPVELRGTGAPGEPVLALAVSRLERDGTLILKVANPSAQALHLDVTLAGLPAGSRLAGERTLLTGPRDAANDREHPERIAPVVAPFASGTAFSLPAPACSVQVLRLRR